MQIIKMKIVDLSQDPANARKHDQKNLAAIKGSLAAFGQQKPIIIDENNIVLAGNGTLHCAIALGWDEIDCVVSDLKSATEKKAFALADNRTSELASWFDDILADQLQSLIDDDFNIESIGFASLNAEIEDNDDDPLISDDREILIVVECKDETQQAQLYQEFEDRKIKCKLM